MGLSVSHNSPISQQDSISILTDTFHKGITFFDTADVYGTNANELLVEKGTSNRNIYSPLGHGFFGGKAVKESLPENNMLTSHPRLKEENLDKNKIIYAIVENLAKKHQCTPPQLALA